MRWAGTSPATREGVVLAGLSSEVLLLWKQILADAVGLFAFNVQVYFMWWKENWSLQKLLFQVRTVVQCGLICDMLLKRFDRSSVNYFWHQNKHTQKNKKTSKQTNKQTKISHSIKRKKIIEVGMSNQFKVNLRMNCFVFKCSVDLYIEFTTSFASKTSGSDHS